jgi:hypothetical protein
VHTLKKELEPNRARWKKIEGTTSVSSFLQEEAK